MKMFIKTSASVLFIGFTLLSTVLIFIQSCTDKRAGEAGESVPSYLQNAVPTTGMNPDEYNNTKGYWENGKLITEFDCPDAVSSFPPIDIKSWYKISVVNGRFPTYAETKNGTAIHHYGEKANSKIRPYNMTLPKLAYRHDYLTNKDGLLVVVIQIAQTAEDTIVSFRYLTGGCGGSGFRDYHFLTDEEVRRVVESKL